MNIVVLGGSNDNNGNLNLFTKDRCIYANSILDNKKKYKLHFSGGFNKKFNKTNLSHSKICKNFFFTLRQGVPSNPSKIENFSKNGEGMPHIFTVCYQIPRFLRLFSCLVKNSNLKKTIYTFKHLHL